MVVETPIADSIVNSIDEVGKNNDKINPVSFTVDVNQVSGIMSTELKGKLAL